MSSSQAARNNFNELSRERKRELAFLLSNYGQQCPRGSHVDVPGVGKLQKLECYIMSVTLDQTIGEVYHNIGVCLDKGQTLNLGAGLGIVNEAEAFRRALEIDERLSSSWFNLGVSLKGKETVFVRGCEYNKKACYERSIQIDPTEGAAFFNLGVTMPKKNELAEIEKGAQFVNRLYCFTASLNLDPTLSGSWAMAGQCLLERVVNSNDVLFSVKPVEATLGAAGNGENHRIVVENKKYDAVSCFAKSLNLEDSSSVWFLLGVALGEKDTVLIESALNTEGVIKKQQQQQQQQQLQPLLKPPSLSPARGDRAATAIATTTEKSGSGSGSVVGASRGDSDNELQLQHHLFSKQDCFEKSVSSLPRARAWYHLGALLHKTSKKGFVSGIGVVTPLHCFIECVRENPHFHARAWLNVGSLLPAGGSFNLISTNSNNSTNVTDICTEKSCFERCLELCEHADKEDLALEVTALVNLAIVIGKSNSGSNNNTSNNNSSSAGSSNEEGGEVTATVADRQLTRMQLIDEALARVPNHAEALRLQKQELALIRNKARLAGPATVRVATEAEIARSDSSSPPPPPPPPVYDDDDDDDDCPPPPPPPPPAGNASSDKDDDDDDTIPPPPPLPKK